MKSRIFNIFDIKMILCLFVTGNVVKLTCRIHYQPMALVNSNKREPGRGGKKLGVVKKAL